MDPIKGVIAGLDPTNDADEINVLKEETVEHKAMCATTQEQAFNYFEKLLSSGNVPKWRQIVKEVCDTTPYFDLKGRKKCQQQASRTRIRGTPALLHRCDVNGVNSRRRRTSQAILDDNYQNGR